MSTNVYFDGLNVFMRHYIANPSVSLHGQNCGGILGFMRNLHHIIDKLHPEKLVVVWEGGGSARRRAIDSNYKQGRRPVSLNRNNDDIPDTVENYDYQLKTLIECLKKTSVTQIYVNDCEADDVIGYICRHKKASKKTIIVSSDKDYYQLIDENCHVWSPNQKKLIKVENVIEKFGIHPNNFCSVRCFSGDQSDGIKGAKGAGFKTISKRFPEVINEEFISVSDIITESKRRINNDEKLKLYNNIVNYSKEALKNWRLMYLGTDNLSATQIKSINYQYENNLNSVNKMDLYRVMIREGLNKFDIDSFFISMKSYIKS